MRIAALVTGIVGGVFAGIGALLLLLAALFRVVARARHPHQAASRSSAARTLAALRAAQVELERQVAEVEGRPYVADGSTER